MEEEKLVRLAWQPLLRLEEPFAGEERTLGCFFGWVRGEGGWGGGSWITLKSTSFKAAASRVRRSEGGLCGGLYSIDARPHLTELVAEHESLSLSLGASEFLFLSRIGEGSRCFFRFFSPFYCFFFFIRYGNYERRTSFVLLEDARRAKYANIERRTTKTEGEKRRKEYVGTLARDFYAVVRACKI